MQFLPVPKIMKWPRNLEQHYAFDRDILITSGCSFTACTMTLDCAASWPGYVRDRGGFSQALDMSCPGVGNQYIHDSIIYAIEHLVDDINQCLVMVMWSGLDRLDLIQPADHAPPGADRTYVPGMTLGDKTYFRVIHNDDPQRTTVMSRDVMLNLDQYLRGHQIPYVSCMYANMLWPPFIPKRDTTHNFQDMLPKSEIDQLQRLPWVVTGNNSLYEWAFLNDYLNSGDFFHPPTQANLAWTDEVFLPAMANQNHCAKLQKDQHEI